MRKVSFKFSSGKTECWFGSRFNDLRKLVSPSTTILVTDENIYAAHTARFKGWNCIVLKAGEDYKVQGTVDAAIEQMLAMEADRSFTLVGIGGGVVTDITGYLASIYMRGIRFGFVPSSLLCMVDASIGGKNGVDVGLYKNMIGTIRQPDFILYDISLLGSLPTKEWVNGFAEIIKHACIFDTGLFRELEKNNPGFYRKNKTALARLVEHNARLKVRTVQKDEFETGPRKLLNFGHTLGHALEKQYELQHGEAIAIGMTYALELSEQMLGFSEKPRVTSLLQQYGLPTYAAFNSNRVFDVLKMDKKRSRKEMGYVLLERIGRARIEPVPLKLIRKFLESSQQ